MTKTEYIAQHRIRLRAEHAEGPKKCSQCNEKKPIAGGRDVVFNRGLNYRWICADCGQRSEGWDG